MNSSQQERSELRLPLIFDDRNPPFSLKEFQEVEFSKPNTFSLYIGNHDGIFPSGFGLRIRFYEEEKFQNFKILDREKICFFEIKIPGGLNGEKRKKVRIQVTFGEIIDHISDYEKFMTWLLTKGVTINAQISLDIKNLFANQNTKSGLTPLVGLSYKRRHFHQDRKRLTIDFQIKNFQIIEIDKNYLLVADEDYKPQVVEVKDEQTNNETSDNFHIDGSPIKLNVFSKFEIAKRAHKKYSFRKNKLIARDFLIRQEEDEFLGLKTSVSPLPSLEKLSFEDDSYFVLDSKRYELGLSQKSQLEENFQVIGFSNNEFLSKIESGEKIERILFDKQTNSIYTITAIHIHLNDGSEINQVQIKYSGKIIKNKEKDVGENNNFQEICLAIFNYVKMNELHPQIVREKISPVITRNNDAEVLPNSTHAHISFEMLDESPVVTKEYDVANSKFPLEKITQLFVAYRKLVQKIYSVPNLIQLERLSDTAFKSVEQRIVGKRGGEIVKEGNQLEISEFFTRALLPLAETILKPVTLSDGKFSPYPVAIPLDLKPDNFVVSYDDELYFVDFFTPWQRKKDGSLLPVFREKSSKSLVFGDFHYMITKFLLWSLKENSKEGPFMVNYLQSLLKQIDPSLLLLKMFRTNMNSKRVQEDFLSIEGGKEVISTII
jgi:hypothetical protein